MLFGYMDPEGKLAIYPNDLDFHTRRLVFCLGTSRVCLPGFRAHKLDTLSI